MSSFGVWDYVVFVAMLIISAGIGVYYRFSGGKQKTTTEYLLADRNMPIWPVSFSLMASFMSAITLLGVSNENYQFGTQFVVINFSYGLATPIAAYLFLPVFFKLQACSAYEYLEMRFGKKTRLAASLAYTLQMILYMGIAVYAPALALQAVTGLDQTYSILAIGIVCTFYSTIGGMKAVLLTDVFQSILMFAAIYAVIICAAVQAGGFAPIWEAAERGGRLELWNFDPDPTTRHTWWSLVIGGMFTYLSLYAVNQTQVQRLQTVKDLKSAQRALWLNWPILSLLSLSTSFSGLCIYYFYSTCDPLKQGRIKVRDQTMPLFVVDAMGNLPGLPGLFVSGIFSASLSSVSAALNSLAAVTLEDYMKPLYAKIKKRPLPDMQSSYPTKIMAFLYGMICLGVAFLAQFMGGVLQASLTIFGVVGGPLFALFSMGMFTKRANQRGVITGLGVGIAISLWIGFGQPRPPLKMLDFSVEDCDRFGGYNSTLTPMVMALKADRPDSDYFYLYRLSYLWSVVLGYIVTFVIGYGRKYPEYNGKNVTIAILDSGVDPRAKGLETIPGGDVKVIERYDCSGCGDVDMSKSVTANGTDGTIVGLSGRILHLSSTMKTKCLSGEYRVGLKSMHDLYPSRIREKIVADAKLKTWDEPHKKAMAEISRDVAEFDAKNPNAQNLPLKEKLTKENLDSTVEFLSSCEKKFTDLKTTYDCVLFLSEDGWMAVIDTTGNGDLENAVHVGEYSRTHEMVNLDDFLSISVNVHDGGDVLEIVGMCSSHGTHVASIACGYHPDNSELDGVAPAAKVVSLTIGDGRLGSMETGTALVRAIIKVMELCEAGCKIDVINMSYGEHGHWSNSGRVGELMSELVNKYGVVWVASAGNHGPALCTIGTPPDISQPSCVGVGAYVSPEMMEAEYALRQKLPANVYTWTSRDPCIDGGFGVTVCAPGAAIASVPQFTMSKAQLMNGTSMAAPHVAGSVALLISGLKQKNVNFTAFSIKRALWNTATQIDYIDKFAQGNGLLNVEKAFENLVTYKECMENNLRFAVSVGANGAKGIHIRQGVLTKPEEFNVSIEPVFFNDKYASANDKISFNVRLTLIPSESWIQCGSFLDLCYSQRTICVKVDPTGLAPGVHRASIKAYDSSCVDKGVMFEIPVTVVQPIVVDPKTLEYTQTEAITCKPNTILRNFFLVPKYATWAVLEMMSTDTNDTVGGKFLIHTMQILPMKYCKAQETQKILPVNSVSTTVHPFKCVGDNILEVCIAKYWSNFGTVPLKYSIKFHGISPLNGNVMHSANGIHRIDLTTLSAEEVLPSVSLKSAVMVLKPSETKITPLSTRDVIHPGRQIYQNVLTYSLHLNKSQEIAFYPPLFSTVLYESEFESQFWMVFDSNKMMIGCGDAYSNDSYLKLEKGDYTVRLQVRHEKKELLEKISETNMLANIKLANTLSVDIYKSYNQAIVNGKKITTIAFPAGINRPIYLAPISNEKLQKASFPNQCSWLEGTIVYAKDELGKKCDTQCFQYILTEGPSVKKNGTGSPKETKSKLEEYSEGLRDYQVSQISKLDPENAEMIYKVVLKDNPSFVGAHLALIDNVDGNELKANLPLTFAANLDKNDSNAAALLKCKLLKIIELADLVIKEIDQNALLAYYGLKTDNRSNAVKIKTQMDKQKQQLLDATQKKLIALSKLRVIKAVVDSNEVGDNGVDQLENIEQLFSDIGKFIDYNDAKVLLSSIWHAYALKQYGRMLKYLGKLYEEKLSREVVEEQTRVVSERKWPHIEQLLSKVIVTSNPQGFRLF